MKRTSDKSVQRFENKKRKIQKFIELIDSQKQENCGKSEEQLKSEDIVSNDDNDNNGCESNFKQMSDLRTRLSNRLKTERPKIFVDTKYLINGTDETIVECLSVEDIQNLILATLLPGPRLSCPPNWCKVFKPTKATKVSIFAFDFDSDLTDNNVLSESQFKYCVQFQTKDDWIQNLLNVRLSNRQLEKMHKKIKSEANSEPIEISSEQKISRTDLLLSTLQMTIEKYPILTDPNFGHFSKTKSKYYPVSDSSPIYSIDCEMCYTTADRLEVTRISVVDENCSVVYDTLVKPKNNIKNYLTKFSGITKKLLDPIDVTLEDVHKELERILPEDAILCGQSLNSDLQALQLIHPYIIDTSVIYNLSGFRPVKPSLKTLAKRFLNMNIQNDLSGHDSAEDAIAAMKLTKLKLSMGMEFGDRVLNRNVTISEGIRSTISITSYLERHNTPFKVFYDYVDIESSDKSLFIYKKHSIDSFEAINRVIHTDKAVCIVLNKNGKCFIKF